MHIMQQYSLCNYVHNVILTYNQLSPTKEKYNAKIDNVIYPKN